MALMGAEAPAEMGTQINTDEHRFFSFCFIRVDLCASVSYGASAETLAGSDPRFSANPRLLRPELIRK